MTARILVVDDVAANVRLLEARLQAEYFDVRTAMNGRSALEMALSDRPDLVLLDVMMPDMTGFEVCAALKEHRPDLIIMDIQLPEISGLEVTRRIKQDEALKSIPVIAVTAFAMKGDEERIRQGGCEGYLSKPISVATFIETVKSYVGEA